MGGWVGGHAKQEAVLNSEFFDQTAVTAIDHAGVVIVGELVDVLSWSKHRLARKRASERHAPPVLWWKEGVVTLYEDGEARRVVPCRVTRFAVQNTAVKSSVYGSESYVVVYKLAPLHHCQGELWVRGGLGGVNSLGDNPGVGEKSTIKSFGPGLRDTIAIFWWQKSS